MGRVWCCCYRAVDGGEISGESEPSDADMDAEVLEQTPMLELLYEIWYYLRELVHFQEEIQQIGFHYQFAATFENALE